MSPTRPPSANPGKRVSKAGAKTAAAVPAHTTPTAADAVEEQLARYRAMRDFSTTGEPSGSAPPGSTPSAAAMPFVIQKHAATRLHYDFRLGWNGVLKSWACAKGPSYVTRDRRLAVEVEDHPMEYGGFEGTIPKGQYGGGTVLLWDQGTWEPHGDVDEGLRAGSLKFSLHGEKLHGKWALVRMGGRAAQEAKPNWLLIKEHDEFEQAADAQPITEAAPDSVVTGRTLDQIADADDHTWNSKPAHARAPVNHSRQHAKAPVPDRAGELTEIPKESFPAFLKPQLATVAHQAPASGDWLHELKLDGYRVQMHLERLPSGPRVTLYTRNGLDWTHRMAAVAEAGAALPVSAAILDGEVVVLDDKGGSSFSALQAAFDEGAPNPLTYFAFDLLHLDGHNLRGLPLRARKERVATLLRERAQPSETLRYGDHVEGAGSGPEVFAQACQLGAEGIIAKLAAGRYTGGRSESWLKLKCVRRQEFVIGGFTPPGDSGQGLGSLLLGYYVDGQLVHCGRTGTGFSQATQRMLRPRLEAIRTPKSSYSNKLTALARKGAVWVRPELVCEVEFATWTGDGLIRHASFQGLREDKPAAEVIKEDSAPGMKKERRTGPSGESETPPASNAPTPESSVAAPPVKTAQPGPGAAPRATPARSLDPPQAQPAAKPGTGKNGPALVAGARLTHPDKVLDPESGVTKKQLALYFEAVAGSMLPHIAGRPSSIVRCPEGATRPCFFQKHAGVGLPRALGSVEVPDKKTGVTEDYLSIDTAPGLVSLAQLGVLEIHPWGSRNDSLEKPDRLIFDLDPDEALPWPKLVASAQAIRELLRELKLESFVKTTGGKGLHLVVPIAPTVEWPRIKLFCRGVAAAIESTDPALYLIKMTKAARKGRIFVDYLRNERGSTAVAPYSPRARAGMRVAVPLDWDELDQGMPTYAVANFDSWRDRLQHDPWAAMASSKQAIPPEVLEAVLEAGSRA